MPPHINAAGTDDGHCPPDVLPKNTVAPASAQGTAPLPYTFKASQLEATPLAGGSVKIIDSTNFNISKTIAVAEVTVEPGAMRYVDLLLHQ